MSARAACDALTRSAQIARETITLLKDTQAMLTHDIAAEQSRMVMTYAEELRVRIELLGGAEAALADHAEAVRLRIRGEHGRKDEAESACCASEAQAASAARVRNAATSARLRLARIRDALARFSAR